MMAPAVPPSVAPMIAPIAVPFFRLVWLPITAPAAPPTPAPMAAPFTSLRALHDCPVARINTINGREQYFINVFVIMVGGPAFGRASHIGANHLPLQPECEPQGVRRKQ